MSAAGEATTRAGDEPTRSKRSLVRYARPELEQAATHIAADRAAGATLGQLAARYGVSIWAIRQVLNAAGLSGRTRASRPTERNRGASQSTPSTRAPSRSMTPTARPLSQPQAPGAQTPTAQTPAPFAVEAPAQPTAGVHGHAATAAPDAPTRPAPSMAGDARKPDRASSPASAGAPTSEHRLTPAQVRRLRAVRALHARATTSTDQAPARLVELVAQLWTEGAQVTDLADALAMAPDAVVTLLRTAGLPAA